MLGEVIAIGITQFLKYVWVSYTKCIITIVNWILLIPVYIFGIGITSIIAKAVGIHFLEIKKENKKSCWRNYEMMNEKERIYRLF